jgi:hypothetical protein
MRKEKENSPRSGSSPELPCCSHHGGETCSDDEGEGACRALAEPRDVAGFVKTVLKQGPTKCLGTPTAGDEVDVSIALLVAGDADSAKTEWRSYSVRIGRNAPSGLLDRFLATMHEGEQATFCRGAARGATPLDDEASGGGGGGEDLGPYGLRLDKRRSCVNLREGGEEHVLTTVRAGAGWKRPREGDVVDLRVRMFRPGGETEEWEAASYTVGALPSSFDRGALIGAALREMRCGELSHLRPSSPRERLLCPVDAPEGNLLEEANARHMEPGGVWCELDLIRLCSVTEVSRWKDGRLLKKQLREGAGSEMPRDGDEVTLKVNRVPRQRQDAAEHEPWNVPPFSDADNGSQENAAGAVRGGTCGDGEFDDVVEFALPHMKVGELASLGRRAPSGAWEDMGIDIELLAVKVAEAAGDDATEKETLDAAEGRLEVGRGHFRKERTLLAWGRFEAVVDALRRVGDEVGAASAAEDAARLQRLRVTAHLNVAACALKLGRDGDAARACDRVLVSAPSNLKALYRRATAHLRLEDVDACGRDLKQIRTTAPDAVKDASIHRLRHEYRQARGEREVATKALFVRMCGALGRNDATAEDASLASGHDSPWEPPRGDSESESARDVAEEPESAGDVEEEPESDGDVEEEPESDGDVEEEPESDGDVEEEPASCSSEPQESGGGHPVPTMPAQSL